MHDLISRQALCEYALNQKDKSVTPNDIMRFPSAQPEVKVLRVPYTEKSYDMFDALTEEEKRQCKWYAEGYSNALKERKTGKWLKMHNFTSLSGDPVWCCSECGKGVHVFGKHSIYNCDVTENQWASCPNCGALMLGEE